MAGDTYSKIIRNLDKSSGPDTTRRFLVDARKAGLPHQAIRTALGDTLPGYRFDPHAVPPGYIADKAMPPKKPNHETQTLASLVLAPIPRLTHDDRMNSLTWKGRTNVSRNALPHRLRQGSPSDRFVSFLASLPTSQALLTSQREDTWTAVDARPTAQGFKQAAANYFSHDVDEHAPAEPTARLLQIEGSPVIQVSSAAVHLNTRSLVTEQIGRKSYQDRIGSVSAVAIATSYLEPLPEHHKDAEALVDFAADALNGDADGRTFFTPIASTIIARKAITLGAIVPPR